MTEIKTYCDHCGNLLDKRIDYDETNIEIGHKWKKADLCCECFEALCGLVKEFCERKK